MQLACCSAEAQWVKTSTPVHCSAKSMQLEHLANFTAHHFQQNVVLKRFTTSHQNLRKEITTFINCSALCFCLCNTITSYNHRSPEDLNATCIRLYLSSAIWSTGWPLRMFWNLNFEPVPPLEAPRGTLHFTDTYSESERAKKCKQMHKIASPKCSDKLKNVLVVQFNFQGVFKEKVRQIHVTA